MKQPHHGTDQQEWHVRRCFALFILFNICTLVLGCSAARGFPDRLGTAADQLKPLAKYFTEDVVNQYNKKAGADQTKYRDEVIENRIRAIDIEFSEFVNEITGGRLMINLGGDLAVIGLNAAGTVVGSAATKTILHAISGGLVGARAKVDKEVFYDQTMPVLVQAMIAGRKEVLARIRQGLASGPQYSFFQALTDVEEYYTAGTLLSATMRINSQSGATTAAAEQKINQVYEYEFKMEHRDKRQRIADWLFARDVSSDPNNQARQDKSAARVLEAIKWLSEKKVPAGTPPDPIAWAQAMPATSDQLDQFIKDNNVP